MSKHDEIVVCGAGGCIGWAPGISLRDGMAKTYAWIQEQMATGNSKDAVVNNW
jgi:hypothetical protein